MSDGDFFIDKKKSIKGLGQRGGSQRTKYSKVARSQKKKIKFATVFNVHFMLQYYFF